MNTEKIGRLTRVLVLSGVVTLGNALGTVTGTANELLSAKDGSKPAKEVVKSNSDFRSKISIRNSRRKTLGRTVLLAVLDLERAGDDHRRGAGKNRRGDGKSSLLP